MRTATPMYTLASPRRTIGVYPEVEHKALAAARERETTEAFAQQYACRAGVEGTISFLKRVLGLFRCYSKGWQHYAAMVGATVLAHNLLILARC